MYKLEKTGNKSKFRVLMGLVFIMGMIAWIYQKEATQLDYKLIDYALIIILFINGVIHIFGGAAYQLNKK